MGQRLSFGSVAILHAVASGNQFGFDIMDRTGLTSGTVYPALDRLEEHGLLRSRWEDPRISRAEGRPSRRYFRLTAAGTAALAEALERHKNLSPIELPGRRRASEA